MFAGDSKGKIMGKLLLTAAIVALTSPAFGQAIIVGGGSVAGSSSSVGVSGIGGSAAGSLGNGIAVSSNRTFARGAVGNVSGAQTTLFPAQSTSGSLSGGNWVAGSTSGSISKGQAGGIAGGLYQTDANAAGFAAAGSGGLIALP